MPNSISARCPFHCLSRAGGNPGPPFRRSPLAPRFRGEGELLRYSWPEVFRLEHDRVAVRRCVGGTLPGVAVAGEGGRVGDVLLGDQAFQRVEPMTVISLAGIGVAEKD